MTRMFLKKFKNIAYAFLLVLYIIPSFVFAYSAYVIPGGENIGIQINSKGIIIVGLYKVNGEYPGKDAGLRVGDKIIAINNADVYTISDMVSEINKSKQYTNLIIRYQRNNVFSETILTLAKHNDNVYKTGLYVKDSVNGIGTLTYIDPNTKTFGALGHEIIEKTTGQKIEVKDGKIFKSDVVGIEKSIRGSPGEKNARFYADKILGSIYNNTVSGVFGAYTGALPNRPSLKVAQPSEVTLGPATIYTVLTEQKVEAFDINIIKLNNNDHQKFKNILFEIIDDKLLDATGGVVQGMSGSPIIQNNQIIGAVTHVIIDDSKKGYGIYLKWMLEEAKN